MTQIGGASDNAFQDGDNYLLPLKRIQKRSVKPRRKRRNVQIGGRLKSWRRGQGPKNRKKRSIKTNKRGKRYMKKYKRVK